MIEFLMAPVATGLFIINLLILISGIAILERKVKLLQEFMKIQNEINKRNSLILHPIDEAK